jgi:hypothetical protein
MTISKPKPRNASSEIWSNFEANSSTALISGSSLMINLGDAVFSTFRCNPLAFGKQYAGRLKPMRGYVEGAAKFRAPYRLCLSLVSPVFIFPKDETRLHGHTGAFDLAIHIYEAPLWVAARQWLALYTLKGRKPN